MLRTLQVRRSHEVRDLQRLEVAGLLKLYTSHVLPPSVLAVWNNGFDVMQHVLEDASRDPDVCRPTVAGQLVQALQFQLLRVDEHPVITRFWTFRDAIDRMLMAVFLGMPSEVLRLRTTAPRAKNSKRLESVRKFLASPECVQLLRRTCLCLQLTGIATSITGQTVIGQDPMLVRLGRAEVQEKVCERLSLICKHLHLDSQLDAGAATGALLATACEICLRFAQYLQYPVRLWRLCRLYNPRSFRTDIMDFLREETVNLDVGVSLPLRARAQREGSEMAAISFLASDPAQHALQ